MKNIFVAGALIKICFSTTFVKILQSISLKQERHKHTHLLFINLGIFQKNIQVKGTLSGRLQNFSYHLKLNLKCNSQPSKSAQMQHDNPKR